ncbi:MAG: VanZ family protein [Armatimonadota bacterium]
MIIKRILPILCWLFWMGLIFRFSSIDWSGQRTASLLEVVLASWFPAIAQRLTESQLEALNFAVRKLAHFVEFGILMLLGYWAFLRGFGCAPRPALRWAIGTSIAYAVLDELRQLTVPGRMGSAVDVLIDTAGVLFVAWLIKRRWSRPGASR